MEQPAADEGHALREWDHVMERHRQRVAFLYYHERYAEALDEVGAGLAAISQRRRPGAKPHATGHGAPTGGGGVGRELLDSGARCALAVGRAAQALEYVEQVRQTWPKVIARDFGFWLLRGQVLAGVRDYAAACESFRTALKIRPTNYSGWLALTSMYSEALAATSCNVSEIAAKSRLCASAAARVRRAFLRYNCRDEPGGESPEAATLGLISLASASDGCQGEKAAARGASSTQSWKARLDGTELSDAEEQRLLGSIEPTTGGEDWVAWWQGCGHCARRAERSAARGEEEEEEGEGAELTVAQRRLQ